MVLVDLSVLQLRLALLLEGDDDQSHEDVDEEERKDNKEDDVEYCHFRPEQWTWSLVLVGGSHRVL